MSNGDIDGREMMGDAEILAALFGNVEYLQAFADVLNGKDLEEISDILEQFTDSKIFRNEGGKLVLSQKGKLVVNMLIEKNALIINESGKVYAGKPVVISKNDLIY